MSKSLKKAFLDKAPGHPFASVTLFAVGGENKQTGEILTASLPMVVTGQTRDGEMMRDGEKLEEHILEAEGGIQSFQDDLKKFDAPPNYFLSITFAAVPGVVDAEAYDLDSPWCFPVEKSEYRRGYLSFERPPGTAGGEVPKHKFYSENWPGEYPEQKKKKS